jgi:hypothetical protein
MANEDNAANAIRELLADVFDVDDYDYDYDDDDDELLLDANEHAPDATDHLMGVDLPDGEVPPTEMNPDHSPSDVAFADNPAPEAVVVLRGIVRPHSNDVLCGRGNEANRHLGNQWYLERVQERKAEHGRVTDKGAKRLVAEGIVDVVRGLQPPGRFLERDQGSGLWNDIGDERAIKKAGQALREEATTQGDDGSGVVERTRRQAAPDPLEPVRSLQNTQPFLCFACLLLR